MTEERISVARSELRAELTDLELRLVDRLSKALESKADSAIVHQLDARVNSLELSRASREHLAGDTVDLERRVAVIETSKADKTVVEQLQRWRQLFPSASVLSAAAAVAAAVYAFLH